MVLHAMQFELRPNMKNKPNAQGTLFRASPSQRTPESRQPRGYSPGRYEKTRNAMGFVGYRGVGMRPPDERGPAAQAIATVARSTVPLQHLKSDTGMNVDIFLSNSVTSGGLGDYRKPSKMRDIPNGAIRVLPGETASTTLIHEIGHHVDRASDFATPSEKGRAEGYADQYAQEHYRQPGYKRRGVTVPSHPEDWHVGPLQNNRFDQERFDYGYEWERHRGQHNPVLSQEQMQLLDKVPSASHGVRQWRWDYPLDSKS